MCCSAYACFGVSVCYHLNLCADVVDCCGSEIISLNYLAIDLCVSTAKYTVHRVICADSM